MTINKEAIHKIIVIQTAFIGDVILATALLEKLYESFPKAHISILIKKGNEELFIGHPYLHEVLIWDKKKNKIKNSIKILKQIRTERYDYLINCHRFLSSGLFTLFSKARIKTGFNKNPLSLFYSRVIEYNPNVHEVERNQMLISDMTGLKSSMPKLYPQVIDVALNPNFVFPFITISPASVWYTKQFPKEKWIAFINMLPGDLPVYLLGGVGDVQLCHEIKSGCDQQAHVIILAGETTILQSAAYMKLAMLNYVNDSAPLHLCSAVNAPVCVVYCSTIPAFGFGPLSGKAHIVQIDDALYCRPCGLHGHKHCPELHFRCALDIKEEKLLNVFTETRNNTSLELN